MHEISLEFRDCPFTVETQSVMTAQGEKQVTYRRYRHIPYVAKPVDTGYQSLDIHVPVSVDGAAVDPQNAPVLILIGVGGYTACPNDEKLFTGPGGSPIGSGPDDGPAGPGGPEGPGGPGGPEGPHGPMGPTPDHPFGDTYEKAGTDSGPKALARGWVVVIPGVRGHDNQRPDGTYYGKAPASIVDLKAVVRYLRYNAGRIPGNMERIFASGGSAAGALASLMATSGNAACYAPYLEEIGAADVRDDIYGCLAFCPITDLSHADGAYEWQYGGLPATSPFNPVPAEMDPAVTEELAAEYAAYLNAQGWKGRGDFGPVNSDTLADYLVQAYLIPSCERFLGEKTPAERAAYLAQNPWIAETDGHVSFTFPDFVRHCGRSKTQPAFDDRELHMEPAIFGTEQVNGRHFTTFGLRYATGDPAAEVEPDVVELEKMMNAMTFLPDGADCAPYWWIRHGTCDRDTSLPVIVGLATALENAGKTVNARLVWDGGHGADDEKFEMLDWIAEII